MHREREREKHIDGIRFLGSGVVSLRSNRWIGIEGWRRKEGRTAHGHVPTDYKNQLLLDLTEEKNGGFMCPAMRLFVFSPNCVREGRR